MRNKNVGYLIVGISIFIFVIILLFNAGMTDIVNQSCDHGTSCTMHDTIDFQTNLSIAIAGLVLLIGVFLIFSKENERVVVQKVKVKEKKKSISLVGLDSFEKKAVSLLKKEGGMFQKSLMEELGVGKVKMTRMLDKLEAKQIIERKRRGMNNFVVLRS